MSNILVTGGAGYIGSHVCKLLAQNGYRPVAFDNLSTGVEEAVQFGPFEQGDILDSGRLADVFAKYQPTAVIHLAAKLSVAESVKDPALYYETNVHGTWCVLQAMRAHNVNTIVFSSSAAVYGTPKQVEITEETPKSPINPYGRSKLMMEEMLADYAAAYGIRSIALRYFNAAGADPEGQIGYRYPHPTNLIPVAVNVLAGETPKLTVFGIDYPTTDGTAIRDYIHVSDLATAHLKALEHLRDTPEAAPACTALNLGTNKGHSVKEVAQMLKNVSGLPLSVIYAERRAGDPAQLVANASKAQALLNWQPEFSDLKTICTTAWNFKKAHPAPKAEPAA